MTAVLLKKKVWGVVRHPGRTPWEGEGRNGHDASASHGVPNIDRRDGRDQEQSPRHSPQKEPTSILNLKPPKQGDNKLLFMPHK